MLLYKRDYNKTIKHSYRTHLNIVPFLCSWVFVCGLVFFFFQRKVFFLAEDMKKQITSVRSQKELNMKVAGETPHCTQPPVPAHWLGKKEPKILVSPLCCLHAPVLTSGWFCCSRGCIAKWFTELFGPKFIHLNKWQHTPKKKKSSFFPHGEAHRAVGTLEEAEAKKNSCTVEQL